MCVRWCVCVCVELMFDVEKMRKINSITLNMEIKCEPGMHSKMRERIKTTSQSTSHIIYVNVSAIRLFLFS